MANPIKRKMDLSTMSFDQIANVERFNVRPAGKQRRRSTRAASLDRPDWPYF